PAPIRDAATRGGNVLLGAVNISGNRLQNLDFSVSSGEIVGVTGLIGCGRSELIRILAGAQQPTHGAMTLAGKTYEPSSPADAIELGVTCVPQDRRRDGIVLELGVGENLTLGRLKHFTTGLAVNRRRE